MEHVLDYSPRPAPHTIFQSVNYGNVLYLVKCGVKLHEAVLNVRNSDCSACLEIPCLQWSTQFCYCIKTTSLVHILWTVIAMQGSLLQLHDICLGCGWGNSLQT